MTGRLRLNLLGGFEAVGESGNAVKISTKKNQALLAYLAADPGKPHTRSALAELLWSDRGQTQARDSLRQSLVALRRDLEPFAPGALLVGGDSLALDRATVATDLQEFLHCCASDASDSLRRAMALFRGDLLLGLAIRDDAFDQWLTQERIRLRDFAMDALERLAPRLAGAEAVGAARNLVGLDPTREGANLALIRALHQAGQREPAVRQARDYRALLKRELAITPSAEFEAEVARIAAGTAESTDTGTTDAAKSVAAGGRAVIAVPMLECRSDEQEAGFIAATLTDNIVTAISRTALFRVAAGTADPAVAAIDYILEGSVGRSDERIRVNVRLIDAKAGQHLWADRYECRVADFMDAGETLARSVTASIETQVFLARRDSRGLERASAHDLLMRCRGLIYEMSAAAFDEVDRLAERAISLEPKNGVGHAMLAEVHLHRLAMGMIPHDAAEIERGLDLAQVGLALTPGDEWAHTIMSKGLSEAGRLEEAVREAERALEINPSQSAAIARLGELHALMGRPEAAIEQCRLALKLNPRNPTNFWRHSSIALAHFVAEDYADMLEEARRVQDWRPDFLRAPLLMAAALAALDRPAEARDAIRAALRQRAEITLETVVSRYLPRFADARHHQRLLDLLRAAGLPAKPAQSR